MTGQMDVLPPCHNHSIFALLFLLSTSLQISGSLTPHPGIYSLKRFHKYIFRFYQRAKCSLLMLTNISERQMCLGKWRTGGIASFACNQDDKSLASCLFSWKLGTLDDGALDQPCVRSVIGAFELPVVPKANELSCSRRLYKRIQDNDRNFP